LLIAAVVFLAGLRFGRRIAEVPKEAASHVTHEC
jgi:hypothetical protein